MRQLFFSILILFLPLSVSSQKWTLQECFDYARKNNLDILKKQNHEEIFKIDQKVAYSKLLPEISFNSNIDYYWKIPVQAYPGEILGQKGTTIAIPIGLTWNGEYSLDLEWKVLDFNALKEIKAKTLQEQASQLSTKSITQVIYRNINAAFNAIGVQEENIELCKEKYEQYSLIHKMILEQFELGQIDKITLNQSEKVLNEYSEKYDKEMTNLRSCHIDLKFWMGYPIGDSIQILQNKINLESPILSETNLENSLGYQIGLKNIEVEKQKYNALKYWWMPTLSVWGKYGQLGFSDNFKTLMKNDSWFTSGYLGIKLNMPLVSIKNGLMAKKQKRKIEFVQIEHEEYLNKTKRDILQYTNKLNGIIKNLESIQKSLILSEENQELSYQKLQNGIINMIELKEIQKDHMDILTQINQLKLDYVRTYIELKYIRGDFNAISM
jgi:outer membrane protein TolC